MTEFFYDSDKDKTTLDTYIESAECPNLGDNLSEMLVCDMCYFHFDYDAHVPLLLPCGHTFCKECCLKLGKEI
jgi:hypothetical protein